MRITTRMKRTDTTKNTTRYAPLDQPPSMYDLYANTEALNRAGLSAFDTIAVAISTEEIAATEVALTFPPVPFYRLTSNAVRYEHRVVVNGRERMAPNTFELPVTRAYVEKRALPDQFVAQQRSLFLGISPVLSNAQQIAATAAALAEIVREESLAAFDVFLEKYVRRAADGRLTSRQVWRVWANLHGADPRDREIAGVRFADVAHRIREVLGIGADEKPAPIEGRVQRYWTGYEI